MDHEEPVAEKILDEASKNPLTDIMEQILIHV